MGLRGVRTKKHSSGYRLEYAPWHPAAHATGFVYQHRLRMEAVLGRLLLPGETVHHKNGVRWDNRPENLEVWCTSQPAGQRPADLVVWAVSILSRYAPEVLAQEK